MKLTEKLIKPGVVMALLTMAGASAAAAEHSPSDYVSTLVGTQSKHSLSTGNTYPAVALPWGMNFWTPQTGKCGDGWAYTYDADKIRGIKQTHQPSPWINDYAQFALMPVTGDVVFDEDARASWFSHKAEEARPYYYKVYLADHDVVAEVTPTERAAAFRFTFPENDLSTIVIDPFDNGSMVKVIPSENKVIGYTTKNSGGVPDNFKNYFEIVFDTPFTYYAAVKDGEILQGQTASETDHAGAIVGFKTKKGQKVNAKVSSSFISPEQASLNMKELGDGNFDRIKAEGKARWDDVLGRIEVEDTDLDRLRTFYSCLYRSVLFPRSFYEFDAQGQPVHYSPYNGEVLPGYMFTDTGFWDTFRALFPMLNLLYPSENEKMQEGLANAYRESGFLPEWASPGHRGCMVGNNSASVVADAWLKGVKVPAEDIEVLWEAVVNGVCGAAEAVNLIEELDARGCTVTAGVLDKQSEDWKICHQLGISCVDIEPFTFVTEEKQAKNLELMKNADMIVVANVPFGEGNIRNLHGLELVPGKIYIHENALRDDYTDGKLRKRIKEIEKRKEITYIKNDREFLAILKRAERQ